MGKCEDCLRELLFSDRVPQHPLADTCAQGSGVATKLKGVVWIIKVFAIKDLDSPAGDPAYELR